MSDSSRDAVVKDSEKAGGGKTRWEIRETLVSGTKKGWGFGVRFVKGLILSVWIVFFFLLVSYTAAHGVAGDILVLFEKGSNGLDVNTEFVSGAVELDNFLKKGYPKSAAPPIGAVLDTLLVSPGWGDRLRILPPGMEAQFTDEAARQAGVPPAANGVQITPSIVRIRNKLENDWRRETYRELFSRVARHLQTYANDGKANINELRLSIQDVVPDAFIVEPDRARKKGWTLPAEAQDWIRNERDLKSSHKLRAALIDTFAILLALGTFGSLIFLVRHYVSSEDDLNLAAYIFRPIFGMFLGGAVFVLDIATHALISSSDMLNVRPETLYFLAFAAGLLSEKAYLYLEKKAGEAIDQAGESTPPKDASARPAAAKGRGNQAKLKTSESASVAEGVGA